MRKYKKTAILAAVMVMGMAAISGCGGSKEKTESSEVTETSKEQETTTIAPDLTEKETEAVVRGTMLIGKNERYQMPLPNDDWKIETQSEESVKLVSGKNNITVQYLTGNAADEVDIFYNVGEYEAYRQETEELHNYKLIYYKNCAIGGEMDGYMASVEDEDGNNAKVSAAFGFPNTSGSYVMYTINADLSNLQDDTLMSVSNTISKFTALRSTSTVKDPEEAAESAETVEKMELPNQYADTQGRFEIALPEGEWLADESVEGTVILENNGQKITISIAQEGADVLIPTSYEEFYNNLIPESESGADELEVLNFCVDESEKSCIYEYEYFDEYATSVKGVKEIRKNENGIVYTVRAEYTKDVDPAMAEQEFYAVDTFTILQ